MDIKVAYDDAEITPAMSKVSRIITQSLGTTYAHIPINANGFKYLASLASGLLLPEQKFFENQYLKT